MWAKLDDALLDHAKILKAGALFGRDGAAKALGFYLAGLLYTQKHLTNGFLSTEVVRQLRVMDRPLDAARTMVAVNLWERAPGGYRIHDFHDHNPKAEDVKRHLKHIRQVRRRAGLNGAKARWNGR